jgi:type VI secretion system secreted protein VgrG
MVFEAKTGDIVLKTKGGSIVLTESGEILIKGAKETHEIAGTLELGAAKVVNQGSVKSAPVTEFWGKMNVGKFSQQVVLRDALTLAAGAAAGYAYKILAKDGSVLQSGKLDKEGKTARVFTEDMEELQVEIDRNNGKWEFLEDVKHDPDMETDENDHQSEQENTPIGVGVLASKAQISVEHAKKLFMPDGEIDLRADALAMLGKKIGMPASTIVHILKRSDNLKEMAAGVATERVLQMGREGLVDLVERKVNHSAAKLVAMVTRDWRGEGELPRDVSAIFEEAAAKRARDIAKVLESATSGCFGIDEDAEALSLSDLDPLELDGSPADLRPEEESPNLNPPIREV